MATSGPFGVNFTKVSSGNGSAIEIGGARTAGAIAAFSANFTWSGWVYVPLGVAGTASWEMTIYSGETSGNIEYQIASVELVSGSVVSGAARTNDGSAQVITLTSPANEQNQLDVALASAPTAGRIREVDVTFNAANTTAAQAFRFLVGLKYA